MWGLHRERTVCYFPALIICCWFVLSMSNYECGCICMFRGAVLLSCPGNPVIAFYHRMSSPFLSALTTGHVVGPLSSFCANDAKLNHESLCTFITQCFLTTIISPPVSPSSWWFISGGKTPRACTSPARKHCRSWSSPP